MCRRLMTVPGVGPVVALTYRATVDVPARFRSSKAVGAVFGLTPCQVSIGRGRPDRRNITLRRRDDAGHALRSGPDPAAASTKWSWLKAWAMQIARRRGMKKAIVALARRLAVIMHRIWVDGTEFRWTREQGGSSMTTCKIKSIGENANSTERWNDVPRGTMDEVSSHVRLDLPSLRRQGRPKDCSASSSNPMMEGPWCRFRREARARE